MEITQEQLDQMVADRIADAKKGLFTEEDLHKKVTAEVDRRVDSGIQKGLETQRKKWETDFAERAKLSAEELAKKEFDEKFQGLAVKEKETLRKANQLTARELLTDAQIPKSYYDKFIGVLVSEDEVATQTNVQNFIDVFNLTKTDIETKIRSDMSKIPPPNTGNGDKVITKADFNKMGYADKIKFKQTNPEMYKEFIK